MKRKIMEVTTFNSVDALTLFSKLKTDREIEGFENVHYDGAGRKYKFQLILSTSVDSELLLGRLERANILPKGNDLCDRPKVYDAQVL